MFDATPLLKLYTSRRNRELAYQDVESIQRKQLLSLVRKAQDTIFGRDHGFKDIHTIEDYQKRVPLRTYDELWTDYWKAVFPLLDNCTWPGRIPFYAVSSGTSSGTTKWIPYTNEMTQSNKQGGLDLLTHHMVNRPKSKIFGGRCFMLGGSTDLVQQANGIYSGDLSGIAVKTMAWWAKARYFPPARLALLKNWEEKIQQMGSESLKADIRMLSGVPSWMLIFFDKLGHMLPESGGKVAKIYPDMEMLVHGGVNFAPYKKQFDVLLEGSKAETREVYPASEGFIAVADRSYGEGMRLILDHGIFFEFVPLEELNSGNPTRLWINDVECNVNYAIVMTTCAGLWSYVIGDTVKFVERRPPRILVTGRTSYYLSAFGEHVIAEEVEDAVSTAAGKIGYSVVDYSVGPCYPENTGELGGHYYVVEFSGNAPSSEDLNKFAEELDARLCQRNEDYEAHRAKGYGLKAPIIKLAKQGTFAAWMKSRGKLGGQNKVPRIIMNQELFADLKNFAEKM